MPTRICSTPGCPEPVKMGRCAKHQTIQNKKNRSPFNSFYASKPWRIARRAYLFHNPLCEYVTDPRAGTTCGIIAEHVHHIIELTDGGAPRNPENLLAVCHSHHSLIHAQRRGGIG